MLRAALAALVAALVCAPAAGAAPSYAVQANRICAQEHARFARTAGAIADNPAGYVRFATAMKPTIARLHRRLAALTPPRGSASLHRYLLEGIATLGQDVDDVLAAHRRNASAASLGHLIDRFFEHANASAQVAVALKLPQCVLS